MPATALNARPGLRPAAVPSRNRGLQSWQRGRSLAQAGRWPQATRWFELATERSPQDALYWINLANARRHQGDFETAAADARRGLALRPGDRSALLVLGECLSRLHRYAQAVEVLAQIEAGGHADPEAMVQQAAMLLALQKPGAAAPLLLRALALKPHLLRGHALLADALRDQGLKREAVECMKTVLALEPGNLEALSHLSYEKRHLGDWSDLAQDMHAIAAALAPGAAPVTPVTPVAPVARVAACFGLLSLPLSPAQHLAAARGEWLAIAQGVTALPALPLPALAPQRLKLGWVSFDFREHPVSQLLVQTLELIDRRRFEVLLYSAGPDDGSPLRQRVQAAADHFVDLRGMSDQQAAERVRADGVHLLIDLAGHTRGHRLGVFARRPAPLQFSYLGFPASTGSPCIDYLIGDPWVTPLEHAAAYTEKLAQLPGCLQPNGRWRPLPQAMRRADAGLPEHAFVMCAFNHSYKILPPAFDAWCTVLREQPQAVLWLKQSNPQVHERLRIEAAARGVASERLVFAPTVSYADHFSRLALADVFVDTWPYNAHTTAADALWAGLPVLTLCGESYASRVAASVLQAVGLPELAMHTEADYTQALRVLASEPELLQSMRYHLQSQRLQLPLFDCEGHTLALQSLFERAWQRYLNGLPPEHLLPEHSLPEHSPHRPAAPQPTDLAVV